MSRLIGRHRIRPGWVPVLAAALLALGTLLAVVGLALGLAVMGAPGWGWTVYLIVGGLLLVAALGRVEVALIAARDRRDAVAWRALADRLGRGRPGSTSGNVGDGRG